VFLSGGLCGSGRGLGLEGVGEALDNQWILCVKGVQLKSLGLDFGDRWGRACSAKIVWKCVSSEGPWSGSFEDLKAFLPGLR